jgi:cytochrome b involved in lipid metabolism
LFDVAGVDATEAFEDVGHSEEARALLKDMFVGDLEGVSRKKKTPEQARIRTVHHAPPSP